MFGAYGLLGTSTLWELQSWSYVSLVPVFIIGSLPWAPWLRKKLEAWAEGDPGRRVVAAPEKGSADVALLAALALSAMSVVSSSYNPFIYFQF